MRPKRLTVGDDRTSHLDSIMAELQTLDDQALVRKLTGGCDDALAVLYERHAPSILRLANRVIGDLSEAEDTVQQVFLELHRSAERLATSENIRSWLHSRGFRRALNKREHLELRGFYKSQALDQVEAELVRGSGAQVQLFPPELSRLVDELLAQVSRLESEVIRLYLYEGLSMQQIALQLKKTYAVVRHNFYNGLNKMRSLLTERERLQKPE